MTTIKYEDRGDGTFIACEYDKDGNEVSKTQIYPPKNVDEYKNGEVPVEDWGKDEAFPEMTVDERIKFIGENVTLETVEAMVDGFEFEYADSYKDIINSSEALTEEEKQKYIETIDSVLAEKCGFDKDYKNENSQVSTPYYEGQSYTVEQDGEILRTINNETGEITEIDMST